MYWICCISTYQGIYLMHLKVQYILYSQYTPSSQLASPPILLNTCQTRIPISPHLSSLSQLSFYFPCLRIYSRKQNIYIYNTPQPVQPVSTQVLIIRTANRKPKEKKRKKKIYLHIPNGPSWPQAPFTQPARTKTSPPAYALESPKPAKKTSISSRGSV